MNNISQKFIVEGGHKLNGKITVGGSKNAVLPILCATLLSNQKSTIRNVPDIADIHTLLKIFADLNVTTTYSDHTITVDPSGIKMNRFTDENICNMRGSAVLIGPLLTRFNEIDMPIPGGCVLGKRSFGAHTTAFKHLGVEVINEITRLHLKVNKLKSANIIMSELSVTATENIIMAAVLIPGKTEIHLAAMEPHVQDLCHCLVKMGAKIQGIGNHHLVIEGVQELNGVDYTVTGDYLQVGTYAIASLVTQGEVTINGFEADQLDSFWQKLEEVNANFELKKNEIKLLPSPDLKAIPMLRTAVYPSFATDLQAPFAVLLTQAKGESKIFETLFESRLNYLFELENMKAKVQMLNPHQAIISGPTKLRSGAITSCDIRAGAAMVLAALCADGITEISNIKYIDRGYEKLDEKLNQLGAKIQRITN